MKKAKFMLTSFAVLAVVGGALAFRAKHYANKKLFCNDANNLCLLTTTGFTTYDPCGDGSEAWSTISNTSLPCPYHGINQETY